MFLDEIGDLSPDAQAKLLRFLETGETRRVGTTKALKVNVRIVAATNRDLLKMVEEKTFRRDLYDRLAHFVIELHPLRERPADLKELTRQLLARACREYGRGSLRFSAGSLKALRMHGWPGNVRELKNAVFGAVLRCEGKRIQPELLKLGPSCVLFLSEEEYFRKVVRTMEDHYSLREIAGTVGITYKALRERLNKDEQDDDEETPPGLKKSTSD